LGLKIHTDEFASLGGVGLAVDLGAVSVDHLCAMTDVSIKKLANSETVAVLLPGTTFYLGHKTYAPARKMIESDVCTAIATDFNPGSNVSQNLFLTATIACIQMGLSEVEAWQAITTHAAKAIGLTGKVGELKEGLPADLIFTDVTDITSLFYFYGHSLITTVIKNGKVVYKKSPSLAKEGD